jgi:hypothetical protein
MEDEARTKEFEGKVAGFKALALPKAFAGAWKEIHAKAPDAAKVLDEALAAADEQCSKGELFTERGSSGAAAAGSGSAYEQASAIAAGLVKEGKAPNFQKALSMAWDANPELYKQHTKERRKAS